jgi:hypothetical protein
MVRERAAVIVRRAEGEIGKLATAAFEERDYDTAELLLGIARNLGGTAARLDGSRGAEVENGTAPRRGGLLEGGAGGQENGAGGEEDEGEDAPVFERDGAELIKTGRSRDGKTYEHKAPRSTVDAMLRAVGAKAKKDGEFRTGRVFPLLDGEGRKLPVYQGYLVLRWLRQIGLVSRVARQRYRIDLGKDAVAYVSSAWEGLHSR